MSLLSLSRLNLIDGCLSTLPARFVALETRLFFWESYTFLRFVKAPNAISVKPYRFCTCLHSGGLAERLNRLQCRQRSAVSFWRHQSLSDTLAAIGDLHKSTVSLTKIHRDFFFLLTFASESSQSNFNKQTSICEVAKLAGFFFFFFVCDFMERQRSGSAGCISITGSELWSLYVGDRKLLASVFYILFFSFFLSVVYQTTCVLLL